MHSQARREHHSMTFLPLRLCTEPDCTLDSFDQVVVVVAVCREEGGRHLPSVHLTRADFKECALSIHIKRNVQRAEHVGVGGW